MPSMRGLPSVLAINRRKAVAFGRVTKRGERRSGRRKVEKQQAIPARRVCWPVIRVLQRRYLATLLIGAAVSLVAGHYGDCVRPTIGGLTANRSHVTFRPGLLIGG